MALLFLNDKKTYNKQAYTNNDRLMKSAMKKNQTGKRERSDKRSHLNGVIKEGPSEEVTAEWTPTCT